MKSARVCRLQAPAPPPLIEPGSDAAHILPPASKASSPAKSGIDRRSARLELESRLLQIWTQEQPGAAAGDPAACLSEGVRTPPKH